MFWLRGDVRLHGALLLNEHFASFGSKFNDSAQEKARKEELSISKFIRLWALLVPDLLSDVVSMTGLKD